MSEKYISQAQIEARNSESSRTGKKELLIKTGLKLMQERGVENTSVDDITEASGVAKGTFYYYFESKTDFLKTALIGLNKEDVIKQIRSNEMKNKTVSEKICFYIEQYARIMKENMGWDFCKIWGKLAIDGNEANERLHSDMDQVLSILNEAKESGELRPDIDCKAMSRIIITCVYGSSFLWYMERDKLDIVDNSHMIAAAIENVLKPYLL